MVPAITARLADGWRSRVDPTWLEGWGPRRFELGDGATEVVVTGRGPAVVLLPALPGYKEMWLPVAARLRRRFRIVTFDLRVRAGAPSWELLLRDLECVADAFAPGAAVVVGHSLGGALAQRWALARPERVRRLVLSSSFARVGSLRGQWRKRVVEQLAVLASQRLLPEVLAAPLARRLAAREAWVFDDRCDDRTLAFVRHGIRSVSPRLARACLGLAFAHDTRTELPRVAVPTLVVVGERDAVGAFRRRRDSRCDTGRRARGRPRRRPPAPALGPGLAGSRRDRLARSRGPMRCSVTLASEGGAVVARCAEFPECTGRGAGNAEAMTRLRESVLFWLEGCPCDQTAGPGLELIVVRDDTR